MIVTWSFCKEVGDKKWRREKVTTGKDIFHWGGKSITLTDCWLKGVYFQETPPLRRASVVVMICQLVPLSRWRYHLWSNSNAISNSNAPSFSSITDKLFVCSSISLENKSWSIFCSVLLVAPTPLRPSPDLGESSLWIHCNYYDFFCFFYILFTVLLSSFVPDAIGKVNMLKAG